jgi:HAD superfamily hydrolase (TIGR01509 family)
MVIRSLILDFDGLILDTETPMRDAWHELLKEYHLRVSEEDWARMLGSSEDPVEIYNVLEAHLGRPVDRGALRERRMIRELELLSENGVLPGVRELITEAKSIGLKLAVASSSDHAWVEGLLSRHALQLVFDVIVCSDDVERTKPFPDLYRTALERLNVLKTEAIAFEDSQHGVLAAKRAGLFCVAVPNDVTRCLSFADADLVVSRIDDRTIREYACLALRRTDPSADAAV